MILNPAIADVDPRKWPKEDRVVYTCGVCGFKAAGRDYDRHAKGHPRPCLGRVFARIARQENQEVTEVGLHEPAV